MIMVRGYLDELVIGFNLRGIGKGVECSTWRISRQIDPDDLNELGSELGIA